MPINCDPATLARASSCYCYDDKTADGALIYLLNQISGLNLTSAQLAANAKCFCMERREAEAVISYLLCQIASASGA